MPNDLPPDRLTGPGKRGLARFVARWTGGEGTSVERRGDVMVAALGLTLGLTAAIFPWYVFFNQEQFGVRAMRFEGREVPTRMPADLPFPTEYVSRPVERGEIPLLEIDAFSTGNVDDRPTGTVPLAQQPFPGEQAPPRFRIVHIENGRAMLEDDSGLWLVQIGGKLPDGSRVATIERRDGAWVVVTDKRMVLKPSG